MGSGELFSNPVEEEEEEDGSGGKCCRNDSVISNSISNVKVLFFVERVGMVSSSACASSSSLLLFFFFFFFFSWSLDGFFFASFVGEGADVHPDGAHKTEHTCTNSKRHRSGASNAYGSSQGTIEKEVDDKGEEGRHGAREAGCGELERYAGEYGLPPRSAATRGETEAPMEDGRQTIRPARLDKKDKAEKKDRTDGNVGSSHGSKREPAAKGAHGGGGGGSRCRVRLVVDDVRE